MSASLVGSEMCIRDRLVPVLMPTYVGVDVAFATAVDVGLGAPRVQRRGEQVAAPHAPHAPHICGAADVAHA
eukprot:11968736-Alexandrium_andersonii.AAC.1